MALQHTDTNIFRLDLQLPIINFRFIYSNPTDRIVSDFKVHYLF